MKKERNWERIKRACAYGVGDIGNSGTFYIIGLYFTVFLTQVESISVWWAGIIVLAGKVVDAITDPVMGAITDRTRSKLGRYRPYFIWGALPLALTYFMLFYSFGIPAEATTTKAIYYLVANILFSIMFTIVYVPYNAMLPTLSKDYHERTTYVGIRNIFSCIGCVLPYFLSTFIVGNSYSPAESKGSFATMGLVFALFFAGSIVVTFLFVKEKSTAHEDAPKEKINLKSMYREYGSLFRSKSYRVYLIMTLCASCMSGMIIGSYFYYVAYIGAHYQMYSQLFFFHGLTEIAGLPLVFIIARKLGKQLPFRVTMPVMIFGLSCTFFLSPATSQPWMLYVLALLIGFGVSGIGMVNTNLYSDLTDVDELMTGQRREGICSGVATFTKKLISGIAVFMVSIILGIFGFKENPVGWNVAENGLFPQVPSVVTGTRIVFAVIPILLAITVIIMTFRYKVDAPTHARVQEAIAQKHETGKADLTPEDVKTFEDITGQKIDTLWIAQT